MRTNVMVARYSVSAGEPGRTQPSRSTKGSDFPGFISFLGIGAVKTDAGGKTDITAKIIFWKDPILVKDDSVTVNGVNYRVVVSFPRQPTTSTIQYVVECTEENRSFSA